MINVDIRYLHIYKKCIYLLDNLKKINPEYYYLYDEFLKLINFFLYKKIRGFKGHIKTLENRWNKVTKNIKDEKNKELFFKYFKAFYNKYEHKNLDIKCIYFPIEFFLGNYAINGNINFITKNRDKKYNVYFLYIGNIDTKCISIIIGSNFISEFKIYDFNIVYYNLKNNKSRTVRFNQDSKIDSEYIMRYLEKHEKNCKTCKAKQYCTEKNK